MLLCIHLISRSCYSIYQFEANQVLDSVDLYKNTPKLKKKIVSALFIYL